MVVLRPLKVNIKKGGIKKRKISIPDFPDTPEKGSHEIAFSDVIYIEKDDFMEVGDKGYRRLTKDQHVGLRYANYVVKFLNVVKKDSNGEPLEIDVEAVSVDQVSIFNIYSSQFPSAIGWRFFFTAIIIKKQFGFAIKIT